MGRGPEQSGLGFEAARHFDMHKSGNSNYGAKRSPESGAKKLNPKKEKG